MTLTFDVAEKAFIACLILSVPAMLRVFREGVVSINSRPVIILLKLSGSLLFLMELAFVSMILGLAWIDLSASQQVLKDFKHVAEFSQQLTKLYTNSRDWFVFCLMCWISNLWLWFQLMLAPNHIVFFERQSKLR